MRADSVPFELPCLSPTSSVPDVDDDRHQLYLMLMMIPVFLDILDLLKILRTEAKP